MTYYRREKTVRGFPGVPTHNRPCSRPVYGTPKMSTGRAADSGLFWVGSEDSNERIASGDCQVKPTTHECFSYPSAHEPHGLVRKASSQIRGTSVRCRRSCVAPPPAPSVPDIPPEMERMRILQARTNGDNTSAARQVALQTLNWLRVFRSAGASRIGKSRRQQRQTGIVWSEKCRGLRGTAWHKMQVIAGFFWVGCSCCTARA
jgi:hypothetical protein